MSSTYRVQIRSLIEKINNDELELGLLKDMLNLCGEYVEKVNQMGSIELVDSVLLDGEEFRASFSRIDSSRTVAHNSLIASVNAVNRICKKLNLEPLFKGNADNRIEVAEFALEIVIENFALRKK